ncbi:MAG: hypothetical protein KBD43_07270 [Saprospiraceae bacterium]|nr:hypothetical protein [Saprospiraceae bacterium]
MSCWICEQKAAFRQEAKNKIIEEAKIKAKENGKTMAIWKEGCIWKTDTADNSIGKPNREFISVD